MNADQVQIALSERTVFMEACERMADTIDRLRGQLERKRWAEEKALEALAVGRERPQLARNYLRAALNPDHPGWREVA